MYDSLPKNERTFQIDEKGVDTDVQYKGDFTVKCVLNMGARHREELEKTRLMADYANPSNGLFGIATTLATLRVRIVKGPDWWTESDGGTNIIDENIVLSLYDECLRLEREWRKELKDKAEESQLGNDQKASE